MNQKFLKRLIAECPLTDFLENGNVNEHFLQLDEYLEKFTSFLYSNESQLTQHFGKNTLLLAKFYIFKIQHFLDVH